MIFRNVLCLVALHSCCFVNRLNVEAAACGTYATIGPEPLLIGVTDLIINITDPDYQSGAVFHGNKDGTCADGYSIVTSSAVTTVDAMEALAFFRGSLMIYMCSLDGTALCSVPRVNPLLAVRDGRWKPYQDWYPPSFQTSYTATSSLKFFYPQSATTNAITFHSTNSAKVLRAIGYAFDIGMWDHRNCSGTPLWSQMDATAWSVESLFGFTLSIPAMNTGVYAICLRMWYQGNLEVDWTSLSALYGDGTAFALVEPPAVRPDYDVEFTPLNGDEQLLFDQSLRVFVEDSITSGPFVNFGIDLTADVCPPWVQPLFTLSDLAVWNATYRFVDVTVPRPLGSPSSVQGILCGSSSMDGQWIRVQINPTAGQWSYCGQSDEGVWRHDREACVTCPSENSSPCSGHGSCIQETEPKTGFLVRQYCDCTTGWSGSACEYGGECAALLTGFPQPLLAMHNETIALGVVESDDLFIHGNSDLSCNDSYMISVKTDGAEITREDELMRFHSSDVYHVCNGSSHVCSTSRLVPVQNTREGKWKPVLMGPPMTYNAALSRSAPLSIIVLTPDPPFHALRAQGYTINFALSSDRLCRTRSDTILDSDVSFVSGLGAMINFQNARTVKLVSLCMRVVSAQQEADWFPLSALLGHSSANVRSNEVGAPGSDTWSVSITHAQGTLKYDETVSVFIPVTIQSLGLYEYGLDTGADVCSPLLTRSFLDSDLMFHNLTHHVASATVPRPYGSPGGGQAVLCGSFGENQPWTLLSTFMPEEHFYFCEIHGGVMRSDLNTCLYCSPDETTEPCHGHGQCILNRENKTELLLEVPSCNCSEGYFGTFCDLRNTPTLEETSSQGREITSSREYTKTPVCEFIQDSEEIVLEESNEWQALAGNHSCKAVCTISCTSGVHMNCSSSNITVFVSYVAPEEHHCTVQFGGPISEFRWNVTIVPRKPIRSNLLMTTAPNSVFLRPNYSPVPYPFYQGGMRWRVVACGADLELAPQEEVKINTAFKVSSLCLNVSIRGLGFSQVADTFTGERLATSSRNSVPSRQLNDLLSGIKAPEVRGTSLIIKVMGGVLLAEFVFLLLLIADRRWRRN